MKQAQITIFMVLGIVIMIIFGLFFFISKQTSGIVLEKRINKIYSDFLDSTNIQHITNNCLDKTTKEALLLVGLQGGRIYDYQIDNGYSIPSFYDVVPFNYTGRSPNGTIYNVSYGIRAPGVDKPHPNPPDYPYPGSLVENPVLTFDPSNKYSNSSYASLFSFQNRSLKDEDRPLLPALCNRLGVNYFDVTGAEQTCETYSSINRSVQEYLKRYIEQNIESCINFTFNATSKYDISTGNLFSLVLIGEDDLLVSLTHPIKISIEGKPPITKYLDFNIRPKIRLKILHEIALHLIGKYPRNYPAADADNIFFSITRDKLYDCYNGTAPCIINGINVSKLPDYCLNNHHCNFDEGHYDYSDILIIEDNKSIIDGKPYRFQFAIENRRPALDFIDESVGQDEYYYWYINATYGKNLTEIYSNASGHPISNDYNIVVETPKVLLGIFPLGIDPDEDNLTYTYTVINSPSGWTDSTFEDSSHYINGVYDRRYVSGFVSDHKTAKDALIQSIPGFSSPPDYIDNVILINVSDNEGLYDYQKITIRLLPSS